MAKLRAAVITDIHYGFDIKDKLGSKAPRLMEAFVKIVNKYAPDFIADMGDRISAKDKKEDLKYLKALKEHFNEAAAPVYSVIGNHDFKNISREDNEEIMRNPSSSYTKDIGGYHLIFWNPKIKITDDGIEVAEESITWLQKDLAKTKKPAILFSHVPLDNLNGEERAEVKKYFYWTQGSRIRKIMEDAGNVILCMGGHRHRNRHREINGIHYITQQSFTSQWREKYRIPSGTFSFLEAEDGKLTVELQGKFSKTYNLKPKTPV